MGKQRKRCLNCGEPLRGKFCHNCGQKASEARITMKSALITSAWNAMRMDNRILPTIWLLLTRPWIVIRDYIKGRRVRYTHPVRLLVVLGFINMLLTLIFGIPDTETSNYVPLAGEGFGIHLLNAVLKFMHDSEVAQYLIHGCVNAPTIWLIFLPFGSRRFNLAEYFVAYEYFACILIAIDVLMSIPEVFFPDLCFWLTSLWLLVLFVKLVQKAFPIQSWWKRFWMLVLVLAISFAEHLLVSYII